MNKISIITVNLNNAEALERTIQSVIRQTYNNYEYLIMDGASQDKSPDIIKKYADHIDYWESEKDTGIYNAMNKAIRKATGDYCYFLNAGDCLASADTLSNVFEVEGYDAPFICGHQINDFGDRQEKSPAKNRTLTVFDFYSGTIKHQATFIRRDLFYKYGLYDESLKIIADWKFFLKTIGFHNEQPVYVDTDIVIFAWDGISTHPRTAELHKTERQRVLDEYLPASVQKDYQRLQEVSHYAYIADAMKKNSYLDKIIRALIKVFG